MPDPVCRVRMGCTEDIDVAGRHAVVPPGHHHAMNIRHSRQDQAGHRVIQLSLCRHTGESGRGASDGEGSYHLKTCGNSFVMAEAGVDSWDEDRAEDRYHQ